MLNVQSSEPSFFDQFQVSFGLNRFVIDLDKKFICLVEQRLLLCRIILCVLDLLESVDDFLEGVLHLGEDWLHVVLDAINYTFFDVYLMDLLVHAAEIIQRVFD